MALAIQDILETVYKVPYQFAREAAQLLANMAKTMMQLGFDRYMKELEANLALQRGKGTAAPGKTFKKPPFLRGLDVGKEDKLFDLDQDDHPKPRPN